MDTENLGIAPIIDSILIQRNFYPVLPFKVDEENKYKNTNVSLENLKYMSFDIVPDLFIYPNKSMSLCFKSEKSKNIFYVLAACFIVVGGLGVGFTFA